MRELTCDELERIDGGVAPAVIVVGVGMGAVSGGIHGYLDGGGVPGMITGSILGGVTTGYGVGVGLAMGVGRVIMAGHALTTHWLRDTAVSEIKAERGS